MSAEPLVELRDLQVEYWQRGEWATVVQDLALEVHPGEAFGLVGESGCGKSTTANALLGYRPGGCRYSKGTAKFCGRDMLRLPREIRRQIVGREISLVPQNPATALSPGMRVGKQIAEVLTVHGVCTGARAARRRTMELMELVSLRDLKRLFEAYPHNLSGGQQQRVLIAMALACNPRIVVLDEPTTGLDVTTQAQILALLLGLRSELGMAMFYITHNLGVVATIADRIGVMYAGSLVEVARRDELFYSPIHPYTQGLIASVPRITNGSQHPGALLQGILRREELPAGCAFSPRCQWAAPPCFTDAQTLIETKSGHQVACWRSAQIPEFASRLTGEGAPDARSPEPPRDSAPLLEIRGMTAGYSLPRWFLGKEVARANETVSQIDLQIERGETLALVGESGSGKTTIARAVSGTLPYVDGNMFFQGRYDLRQRVKRRPPEVLRLIQFIFQNPDASLNPRHRVGELIGRPLTRFYGLRGAGRLERVASLLADVRLPDSFARRFPDELSGGERQRVALARALAADPALVLCDEILSALDVSVQASILDLLAGLQSERRLAYLFISHDLAVVHTIAHRVAVIYRGRLCEVGDTKEVFQPPFHPYTRHLLEAVPEPDPRRARPAAHRTSEREGVSEGAACPFTASCPLAIEGLCAEVPPPWRSITSSHRICCHAELGLLESPIVRIEGSVGSAPSDGDLEEAPSCHV